jgi:N-sulfoglucosamine sulfohydrolase
MPANPIVPSAMPPTRRHLTPHSSLVTLLLALVITLAQLRAAPPNILHIMSDDHGYPHLGCYGNADIKTPNLDKFASQGMRFDRAYVACPQCVPSRASIMTGRAPIDIDMTRFSAPLPRHVLTYHEHLRKNGYFTGVAGRTFHLEGAKYHLETFNDRLDYVKSGGGDNESALAQFNEFLDTVPQGKSFSLQLCSSDPHRPLNTHGPVKHDPAKIKLPAHYLDTPAIREDFARYYDEIAHFDVFFGQVLAELEKRGLAENTLVLFMADNGCAQFRGKGTLYEFGIHVPMLARWPGVIKPGSVTDELVSGEDLAPTYLEAAGLEAPQEMTGRSFVKLLRGESHEGREFIFAERGVHGSSSLPMNSASFDLGRVVVGKKYKLIYNVLWQIPYWPVDFANDAMWQEMIAMNEKGNLTPEVSKMYFSPTRSMFEMFDVAGDVGEFNNLYGKSEFAEEQRKLKAALHEWMILQRDFVPLPVEGQKGPGGGKGKKGGKGKAKE